MVLILTGQGSLNNEFDYKGISKIIRVYTRRLSLIAFAVLYIGFLDQLSGDMRQGLDPSVRLGVNIFDQYDLHFGTDLVHVYGPLGRLIYPVAGNSRLFHASIFSLLLNGIFISLILIVGFRTRTVGTSICIGALFLFFAHFSTFKIREAHLVGIPLLCYMISIARRWIWPVILGAVLSGFFAFLKFNVAVSLCAMLFVFLSGTFLFRYFSPKSLLSVFVVYISTIVVTALFEFSSISSFITWVSRSWRIASGNSEIMSRSGNHTELLLALLIMLFIPVTAAINRRKQSVHVILMWVALVGISIFFEFKHGFVRAGHHVLFFFGFAPIGASSALLVFPNRRTWIPVVSVVILCSIGSGIEYDSMVPWKWRHRFDFSLITSLAHGRRADNTMEELYRRRICRRSLSRDEILLIGSSSIDLLPFDITPLLCGPMSWRPGPFFQHFLIRDAYSDSVNAAHYASSRAAQYILFRWSVIDAIHPLFWCPETHRSILRHYRPVLLSDNRFLLKRSSPREVEMIPLATVTAGLDEHVDIPRSAYPVVAKIHLGYSSVGNVLKMIYRAPPVFVQFNDGYVSRIVPGTASNGLICNYIPKMPDQLISFYAGTSQRPICPQTNSFRIHMDECSPVFKDEIRIEFEEMRINSDAPDPGEIES